MQQKDKLKPHNSLSYKGYLIRSNIIGDHWVEKDGYRIAWTKDVTDAKKIIDDLTNREETHSFWLERSEHTKKNRRNVAMDHKQTISAEHADVFIHNRKAKNPGIGRAFYFFGSTTSKLAARKLERKHPGSFIHEKDGRYYVLKPKTIRSNPGVPIYGRVLRIEAEKTWEHEYGGKDSKPSQKYYHDFTSKNAMIYGLPDGSLLIKAKRR